MYSPDEVVRDNLQLLEPPNDSFRDARNNDGDQTIDIPPISAPLSINGIEVVPLERLNSPSAKQLAPCLVEKEVVPGSKIVISSKALPDLPASPYARWQSLPVKQRILIIACIQACIAVIAGLSLGFVKGHSHTSTLQSRPLTTQPSNLAPDLNNAQPIPTPMNLPELRRGTFVVPVNMPQLQDTSCLASSNESSAWMCGVNHMLTINLLPSTSAQMNATLLSLQPLNTSQGLLYGLQPPTISPTDVQLVQDTEHPDFGPAFHFQSRYDRTVILSEDQIQDEIEEILPSNGNNTPIQRGDLPWVCAFNQTLFEGYIYLTKNSSGADVTLTSKASSPSMMNVPLIPYFTKLEERRLPNSVQPYCVQMKLLDDGKLVPAADSSGTVNVLQLNETVSVPHQAGRRKRQQDRITADDLPKNCQCHWLYQ